MIRKYFQKKYTIQGTSNVISLKIFNLGFFFMNHQAKTLAASSMSQLTKHRVWIKKIDSCFHMHGSIFFLSLKKFATPLALNSKRTRCEESNFFFHTDPYKTRRTQQQKWSVKHKMRDSLTECRNVFGISITLLSNISKAPLT